MPAHRLLVAVVGAALALGLGVAGPAQGSAPADRSVAQAQHRLDRLHCDAGRADGRGDRHLRSAVLRFQSRVGLRPTGRLTRPTVRRLYADTAPRCDRRPVPRRSGHGRRIVVSQAQDWVWLLGHRGGVVAQGGMVDNPKVLHRGAHVTGSYCGRAARIRRNQDYSGRLWLDDFVRFAPCGIGFHRIPRHKSTGRQIHPDWILGTDLDRSHGCIRLGHALAGRVWSFTVRRTPVRVV